MGDTHCFWEHALDAETQRGFDGCLGQMGVLNVGVLVVTLGLIRVVSMMKW